jgi:hypothetical protein
MQIMRSYGTYRPGRSAPYLSQVIQVPIEQFFSSFLEMQARVHHQISAYGCLVRYFSPTEAFLIAGILPHKGPTTFMWELAGNACCPLLLFEALHLVSSPETRANFPTRDLRQIWLRKLGIAHPQPRHPVFPAPFDATILFRHENKIVACRFQGLAPMTVILVRISEVFSIDPGDIALFLSGDLIPPDSSLFAYDLYGKVICIE